MANGLSGRQSEEVYRRQCVTKSAIINSPRTYDHLLLPRQVFLGGHLEPRISVRRHKIVILTVVNGGKMRTKSE